MRKSRAKYYALRFSVIDSLTAASESDGIGMYHDSEWLYIEIRDEISDFVEENF